MTTTKTVFDIERRISIPAGIAQHAAGPDAYLRDAIIRCDDCGAPYALKDSDSAEFCQDCFDQAGEENARADGNV